MDSIHLSRPVDGYGVRFSKGNQPKYRIKDSWYKIDSLGYESLSEWICSHLLAHSTLRNIVIAYHPVSLEIEGRICRGCVSDNFKPDNSDIITLDKLYRSYRGLSLSEDLVRMKSVRDKIEYTVDFVESCTGMKDFGLYLSDMLTMDALFLNEDRHVNNISFLYNSDIGEYTPTPYYDMGAALFSDTKEAFPLSEGYETCLGQIHSKPFSRDFDEQLDAVESLYGITLKFNLPSSIHRFLDELFFSSNQTSSEYIDLYSKAELTRVKETIIYQFRKYSYLI